MISNKILVAQSFKNKTGDLVVVCETKEERNELKKLVATTNEDIEMRAPPEKRPSITIVGLPKECTKDEIKETLRTSAN